MQAVTERPGYRSASNFAPAGATPSCRQSPVHCAGLRLAPWRPQRILIKGGFGTRAAPTGPLRKSDSLNGPVAPIRPLDGHFGPI